MPNVTLTPLKLSSWRKIALGTWRWAGDPSVYGVLEISAEKIIERRTRIETRGERAPTITAIVAKAVATTLHENPQINGLIRFGKIYLRDSVTVFLQAATDNSGEDLSGILITNAEKKSVKVIFKELSEKAKAVREDRDPNFKRVKSQFRVIPAFMMRFMLNLVSFLLYTLNLDLTWAGLPKDPFGSVMVTSIGSLGLDEGFAPLVPYTRVPMLLAIGALRKVPVIDSNGSVVAASQFKVCVTFDHRFIDGVHAAKMLKSFRRALETNEGLDEMELT